MRAADSGACWRGYPSGFFCNQTRHNDVDSMSTGTSPADLSAYPNAAPTQPINLLFIHHSVGGQLLADAGPAQTDAEDRLSIHRTHPNEIGRAHV